MEAYIEFVILDNFMVTLFIGAASCRFLHVSCAPWRLLSIGAVGTAAAVVFPFLRLHTLWLLCIKLLLGFSLSFLLFFRRCKLPAGFAVFMVVTFMFGGLEFCLGLMTYGEVSEALTLPPRVPVGLLLAAGAVLYLICRKLFLRHNRRKDAAAGVREIGIGLLGGTVRAKGFMDTGNRLYDGITGLPVVVLSLKAILPLLDAKQTTALWNGNLKAIFPDAREIPYGGLGKPGQTLTVIKPQSFRFYDSDKAHILYDVMIGLSFFKITDAVEYDAILHPALIGIGGEQ